MPDQPTGRLGPEGTVLLAAPLSLSGRYGFLGRLAAAGLQQAVQDAISLGGVRMGDARLLPRVLITDDDGTREGVRRALDALAGADLMVGPYGSDLVEEAARWASDRRRVLWNHGGSADEVQRRPGVVSVPTPAGRYFLPVLEALADGYPGARVLLAAGRGAFGRAVAVGARGAAGRLGLRVAGTVRPAEVPADPKADILLLAGGFQEDVETVRRLRSRPPVVGAVAAGIGLFGAELGTLAERVVGPSQWEEGVRFRPDLGPRQADVVRGLRTRVVAGLRAHAAVGHIEYPAAQAYAAALVAMRCVQDAGSLDDAALLEAATRLRCTTFFGRFGLGDDGLQREHEMLAVQWQGGVKRVVAPPSLAEADML